MTPARSARLLVAALAALLVLGAASPAHAVVAATAPGSSVAGYATRAVVAPVGGPVTFFNGDVVDHTLTAFNSYLPKRAARKASWCRGYSLRRCPLFTTGSVNSGESAEVQGLEHVKPGRQYEFYCQIHSGMRGTLVAVGAAQD